MPTRPPKPLPPVAIHFVSYPLYFQADPLSSVPAQLGSGPTTSRGCSSLAVKFPTEVWIFDVADGTLSRLLHSSLKISSITRIFITHMHCDHLLGAVEVLMAALYESGDAYTEAPQDPAVPKGPVKVNVYGPSGIRKLIRTTLEITRPSILDTREFFAVHEILLSDESPSVDPRDGLLGNEVVGTDVYPDENGVWRDILVQGSGSLNQGWGVHAGPIEHRVTSLGYILQEAAPRLPLDTDHLIPLLKSNAPALASLDPPIRNPLSLLSLLTALPPPPPYTLPSGDVLHPPGPSGIPPRKIVIFGDCTGGTKNPAFKTMCRDASVMVHECTRAAIPEFIQPTKKSKGLDGAALEELEDNKRAHASEKALFRGHASPREVGWFVRETQPRRLILNHFSSMFSAPRYASNAPLPPISSGVAPQSYPLAKATSHDAPETPLTATELQTRLIMQSIADQVETIWKGSSAQMTESVDLGLDLIVAPSRDFMALTLGSHELFDMERQQVSTHRAEVDKAMEQWREYGREWLVSGTVTMD